MTSADSPRDRVVAAAKAEFAQYGIAGARVDRIAKAAKTSKERVYAYFASKEALYRAVATQELAAIAEATRMDAADLPSYAGRVHDYFVEHPERARLMAWGQLELDAGDRDDPLRRALTGKIRQLAKAQENGQLDPDWDPMDVLVLVNQIAMAWANQPYLAAAASPEFLAARRVAVVAAVDRLFPRSTSGFPRATSGPSTAPGERASSGSQPSRRGT